MTTPPLVDCPACESMEFTSSFLVRGYQYAKCMACGLMYLPDMLSGPASNTERYDYKYFSDDLKKSMSGYIDYAAQSGALRKNFRGILRRLLLHVSSPYEGRKLLDIGCAYGFLLDEARKTGFQVEGLDLSESAIQWMRENLDIPGTAGNLTDVSLGVFDVITAVEVLEHIESPVTFLNTVRKHLAPGGVLLISTGANDSLVSRMLGKRWWYLNPPDHCCIYSRPALARVVQERGFRIVEHSLFPMHWVGLNNMMLKVARILELPSLGRAAQRLPSIFLPIVHFTTQVIIAVREE